VQRGGLAIRSDNIGVITISQCSFLRNKCTVSSTAPGNVFHKGCAVDIRSSAAVVFIGSSVFDSNEANYTGLGTSPIGAALYMLAAAGNLTISNCQFSRNLALYSGGAININVSTVLIADSLFFQNSIFGSGGAGMFFLVRVCVFLTSC
jgi:predicted outer membrane repeat protein